MRLAHVLILALVAPVAIASASADDGGGWHLNAAAGRAIIDEQFDDGTLLDTSSTAFRFSLGYRFGDYIGLEAGYHNFGDFEQETLIDGTPADVSLSADGFTLALTGRIPLGERVAILGRAGAFFWNGRAQINDVTSASPDDTNLLLGLGVGYQVAAPLMITADVSHYALDDADSTVFSIGLEYRFGQR